MVFPKFVAEVSSNHHQSLDRCFDFIEKSAEIGCDAVKFQLFKIDELFASEILARSEKHRNRQQWELPSAYIPELSKKCHQYHMAFSCTPFYLDAVKLLKPYVDFYKVASYELLWDELLSECAKTGIPVVLSTGMATLNEISHAVATLQQSGCQNITLLHCVSSYPTPPEQCNLSAIKTLKDRCQCAVGWSDHSVNSNVMFRAIYQWQAEMIEFHLDLDGEGEEYSVGHCWLPDEIEMLIKSVKQGILADGNGIKEPVNAELPDRLWRADPMDGLRPFRQIRQEWVNNK
ncbi:MAG: N-acetylneuraminic acid synthase [Methylococcales bacterium]|jgi:N-acetylneuraminate synthase|nr:N-acetylneuraminic acid synthase [Methylococcales bacterium]MBT7409728.1 N-acetylneuraminic acid synthase [Methylococcales bacterium]